MPLYKKIFLKIGKGITGILLFFLFYFVFGIIGVILRIIRKDLLNQKIDQEKQSYWIDKTNETLEVKRYEQQF